MFATTPETVNASFPVVSERLLEVLVEKLASPAYTAVMVWLTVAAEMRLVVKLALPEVFSVAVPSVAVPSLKVIVPVAMPLAGVATPTVAVKVMLWP